MADLQRGQIARLVDGEVVTDRPTFREYAATYGQSFAIMTRRYIGPHVQMWWLYADRELLEIELGEWTVYRLEMSDCYASRMLAEGRITR